MNEELWTSLREAFCNELKDIGHAIGEHEGRFHCARELSDAAECIRAVRDLDKIASMGRNDRMSAMK